MAIDPRLSRLLDILQRIIISYADPDSMPSVMKLGLDRMDQDSITDGMTYYKIKAESEIDTKDIDRLYSTTLYTYDDMHHMGNNPYTNVDIVIADGVEDKGAIDVSAPTPNKVIIIADRNLFDFSLGLGKGNIYYYMGNILNLLIDIFEYSSCNEVPDTDIKYMRTLLIIFGFLKSVYTESLETISNDITTLGGLGTEAESSDMHSAAYIKAPRRSVLKLAVIETIEESDIAIGSDTVGANIRTLLEPFDSGDINYWNNLTDKVQKYLDKSHEEFNSTIKGMFFEVIKELDAYERT